MAKRDPRLSIIITRGRQLGRSLVLLAHYVSLFAAFVARIARWMAEALRWTCLFARYTTSAFDSIYRLLHWGQRQSTAGGVREVYLAPEIQPE